MMKYAAMLGVLFALCSCATAGSPAGTDWKALESEAVSTEPLQLLPEMEPVGLRITLFHVQSPKLGDPLRLVVGGFPFTQPFGVDLGNGLAIDSGGSGFLDVLKLLRIDTSAPFTVERKSDSLLGRATTLTRDSVGVTLKSARVRGTVVQTEEGLTVRNAAGKADMTVTRAQGRYEYKSTIPLDPSFRMKAADEQLTVEGSVQHALRIEWNGDSVVFNPDSGVSWPQYTVTKQGDSYSVRYLGQALDITLKVYFLGDSVYVLQNGIVALTVTKTTSSILVNGKEAVTYSRG